MWSERGGHELHLIFLAELRSLDERDGREGDVDQVELVRQGLYHAAQPVVTALNQRLVQVGAEDLQPALAEIGHGRQPFHGQSGPGGRLDVAQESMLAGARRG